MRSRAGLILAKIAVVVPAAAIAGALLLILPGAPPLPNASAHEAGTGVATTPERHLRDGWYEIHWTAHAGHRPPQGCLFGLRLDPRRPDASPDPRERARNWQIRGNLVYRTLPRDSWLSGSNGPVRLEAGMYRLVVDGWCAWDVVVTPAEEPAPTPTKDTSLEQYAP